MIDDDGELRPGDVYGWERVSVGRWARPVPAPCPCSNALCILIVGGHTHARLCVR